MNVLSTVKLFYAFYSVYTLFVVSVSDYKITHALWGLIAIWVAFFAYEFGFKSVERRQETPAQTLAPDTPAFAEVSSWRTGTYLLHMVLAWVCSILAARYYTGYGFMRVLSGLASGESLYVHYQNYFQEAGLASFSLLKIPFILMLMYVTVILFVSFLGILASGKKITLKHLVYLGSIGLAYYYFGISRGTNFEMYIIFVLLAYCLLCRTPVRKNPAKAKSKYSAVIWVGALGLVAIGIFQVVLTERGYVFRNDICEEIHYNPNSFIASRFPAIASLGLSVFSYLGYGIYAIGAAIEEIVLTSPQNTAALFVPMAYEALIGQELPQILRETIAIGVRWVPDWVSLTGLLGLPVFLAMMFFLGRITAKSYAVQLPKLLQNLVCALSFLFMLSLPVGNFIFASTANLGLLFFAVVWYIMQRHIRISL